MYCSTHCARGCPCCHGRCCILLAAPGQQTADGWIVEQKVLLCVVLLKLGCEPGSANAEYLHFVFASLRSGLSRPRAGSTWGSGAAESCRGGPSPHCPHCESSFHPIPTPLTAHLRRGLPNHHRVCAVIGSRALKGEVREGCVEINFFDHLPISTQSFR